MSTRYWWQDSGPDAKALLRDPQNRAQAIRQGWKPPADEEDLRARLAESRQPQVATTPFPTIPGGLYGHGTGAARQRRREADAALEKHGLREKPSRW